MPSDQAYNAYVNWVMYAVLGKMAQADDLMGQRGAGIRSVAKFLLRTRKTKVGTIYRGVLLEPEELKAGKISQDPRLTFVSFSQDRDVACWFADPRSIMSSFVAQQRPRVKGYVIEYKPTLPEVLFHHDWRRIRLPNAGVVNIDDLARRHPDIAPHVDQLTWNLDTQSEVIVKPLKKDQPVTAHPLAECPPADNLDERFTPPQFR